MALPYLRYLPSYFLSRPSISFSRKILEFESLFCFFCTHIVVDLLWVRFHFQFLKNPLFQLIFILIGMKQMLNILLLPVFWLVLISLTFIYSLTMDGLSWKQRKKIQRFGICSDPVGLPLHSTKGPLCF